MKPSTCLSPYIHLYICPLTWPAKPALGGFEQLSQRLFTFPMCWEWEGAKGREFRSVSIFKQTNKQTFKASLEILVELIVWHANTPKAVPIFHRRPCRLVSKKGWPHEEGGEEAEVKGRDLGAASSLWYRLSPRGEWQARGGSRLADDRVHSPTRFVPVQGAPWGCWPSRAVRGGPTCRARGAAPPGPGGELDFLVPQPGATGWRRSQNPSRWHSCASRRTRGLGAERLHLGWGGMRSETKQRLLPTLSYCCLWLALCVAKWPGRGQVPAAGTKRKGPWCAVCVAPDFRALTLADAPSKF